MKYVIIFAVVLLCAPFVFSQPDSSLADYYPLLVGNYWEYEEKIQDQYIGSTEYSYFSVTVVADTTMPNGKLYKKLLLKSIPDVNPHVFLFERFDTVRANIYRNGFSPLNREETDFLIDSLGLAVDESCEGYYREWHRGSTDLFPATITCVESSFDTVFDAALPSKHFSSNNHLFTPDTYHYWLTKGIGLSRAFKSDLGWRYDQNLVYARIAGKTYGTRTSIETKTHLTACVLYPNYPNPFNPSTTISFSLNQSGPLNIVVFNMLGQTAAILYDGMQTAGFHSINFNAADLAGGVYVCQIKIGDQFLRQKLLLIK